MSDRPTRERGFATNAIHAGKPEAYSSVPIYMSSTSAHFYTRGGNPTVDALEECAAILEGGERGLATACGIAAVTQTLLGLLKSGDRVICHRCVYDWTDTFMMEEAPKFGIDALLMDLRDLDKLREALKKRTQVVYFEPLANPSMDVIDVKAVVDMAHEAGALVVVDNTFVTPYLFQPLKLGVDIVVHSATKYLGGHADALGGVVIANSEIIGKLHKTRNIYGGILSPFNAFLILQGIKTLPLRMDQHCVNAQKVAEFLSDQEKVLEVRYPGLSSHPDHDVAVSQMQGFSGIIGFQVDGGDKMAKLFSSSLKLCKPWVSLGDVETLVYVRWEEERKGVPAGYMRLSVGLEDVEDIIADLDQALSHLP